MKDLKSFIDAQFDKRSEIKSSDENQELKNVIKDIIKKLDNGELRIAEKINEKWTVNQWLKKAVLLSFIADENFVIKGEHTNYFDKIPNKFYDYDNTKFVKTGARVVPTATVRRGSFIGKNVVLMPSFVNIGAYVDDGTMVDTWATIGSCAQIGANCHISGGAGIGGVLEPLQASPVIIEDNCFIGARSEVAEGVIVEEGSVISMGVFLGASTKIIDRNNGKIFYGRVPKYSVVVPGSISTNKKSDVNLYCAVIVKTVDAKTRSKTSINDLLRN